MRAYSKVFAIHVATVALLIWVLHAFGWIESPFESGPPPTVPVADTVPSGPRSPEPPRAPRRHRPATSLRPSRAAKRRLPVRRRTRPGLRTRRARGRSAEAAAAARRASCPRTPDPSAGRRAVAPERDRQVRPWQRSIAAAGRRSRNRAPPPAAETPPRRTAELAPTPGPRQLKSDAPLAARKWQPSRRVAGFGVDALVDQLEDASRPADDQPCITFARLRFRPATAQPLRGMQNELALVAGILGAFKEARVEIGSRSAPIA